MIKTLEIEHVCQKIGEIPVDYDRLFDRYMTAFPNKKRRLQLEMQKHFSEMHLDFCLETIAEKTGITIEKSLPRTETERCSYSYDFLGRFHARVKESNGSTDFEYDAFAVVNGIPVDFEISMLGIQSSKKKKTNTRRKLTQDFYKRKLSPLTELFNSDVGYVFICPIDVYLFLNDSKRSDVVEFKENNGILTPLYFTKEDFNLGVSRIARKNNITYIVKERKKLKPLYSIERI